MRSSIFVAGAAVRLRDSIKLIMLSIRAMAEQT
jgi:hypothetical protein